MYFAKHTPIFKGKLLLFNKLLLSYSNFSQKKKKAADALDQCTYLRDKALR
jgi:hypothetical protein